MGAAARMRMPCGRAITTGKQLLPQSHGLATHVGPNALLRTSSYPAISASPGTGPLLSPPLPSGNTFSINGSTEFDPTSSDAHAGLATNWASGPTTVYAYNNNPGNYGGLVPSGGLVIDGFPVAAGTEVYQFMDLTNGTQVTVYEGVTAGVVFRGCRGRAYQPQSGPGAGNGMFPMSTGYNLPVYFLYCDIGGTGPDTSSQYSSTSLHLLNTGGLVVYRCYFSMQGTAFQPLASTAWCDIQENYIEEFIYNSGDHDNGISAPGGGFANFRWQRNYVVIPQQDVNGQYMIQTDCMSVGSDGGANNIGTGTNPDGTPGYQITGNYCGGGGSPFYLGYTTTPTPNTVSHMNFANNLMTASSWPIGATTDGASGNGGGYNGPVDYAPVWGSNSNTKSGNLWADGSAAGTTFI